MNKYCQQGIGLVEIMVALLLLAIAVLGFSALQLRAVGATDESLVRSRATSVVSSMAEAMRDNIDHLDKMHKVFDGTKPVASIPNCLDNATNCNAEQMAEFSAKEVKELADAEEFKIGMELCPGTDGTSGTSELYCAIVAWGTTNAELGTSSDSNSCADKTNGIYYKGSTCIIMETY